MAGRFAEVAPAAWQTPWASGPNGAVERGGVDAGGSAIASGGGVAEFSRFAADADFRSLRGQLRYAAESGTWSICYREGGGPTDPLGGSLIIANPQVLAGLQPGQFVALQGELLASEAGSLAPMPTFRIAAIQQQRE
jgi:hypothetical protein